jgi:hypothetical protein
LPDAGTEYAARWRTDRPDDAVCIAPLVSKQGLTEKLAAQFLRVFEETRSFITPENLQADKLTVVQRGCRLAIIADVDLAGLDSLGKTLICYEMILQLWAPDRKLGSETL